MKKTILKNGLYSAGVLLAIILLSYLLFDTSDPQTFGIQEVFGYTAIALAMIFVFLGIKQYRDGEGSGSISFSRALMIGIGITLIPSIAFGLYNLFYIEFLDPDFLETYYTASIEKGKEGKSAEEYQEFVNSMEASKASFQSPVVQFFAMFATVFIIGFIATIISSLFLKNTTKQA